MPQIYTKDEIDALLILVSARADSLLRLVSARDESGYSQLESRLIEAEKQHSALLKAFQEHLDKSKKDNGTVSPYAR